MNKQFKPGDAVIIDAGLGITKHGNIQRIAETVAYVKHYNGSVVGYKYELIKPVVMTEQVQKPYGVGLTSEFSMIQSIMEKKLTPAELKKREEVATAIERENPDMDMSKKMAIATATAKKVAEDTEQIDELSKDTLLNYTSKASDSRVQQKRPVYKRDRSIGGEVKAHKRLDKMYGEDVHYCAKHVFSERFGEGLVVEGSHAEPTEEGLIEWYDVDFGGTVRRVMTEKVKVMHAEYHMNHKKKMKEEEELEEAKPHTVPKTAKEKDLAAIAPPHDKITHADVLIGRGVKKEEMSSKEKMKRGLYNKEEAELEEATENLPGKATHLTKMDVRHPEHGIIPGSTTLRHLDGNKYEVRAGRAKGKTVALDKQHVQKLSEQAEQTHVFHATVTRGKSGSLGSTELHHVKAGSKEEALRKLHSDLKQHERTVHRVEYQGIKEDVELDEAMISYSDFQSKIKAHQKAGNQIKDDKYDKKKASYTVIDQEGTAKKITHTDSGVSQQHLGSVKRDDDESSETKPTEKRGRGRPAGSKSGARN